MWTLVSTFSPARSRGRSRGRTRHSGGCPAAVHGEEKLGPGAVKGWGIYDILEMLALCGVYPAAALLCRRLRGIPEGSRTRREPSAFRWRCGSPGQRGSPYPLPAWAALFRRHPILRNSCSGGQRGCQNRKTWVILLLFGSAFPAEDLRFCRVYLVRLYNQLFDAVGTDGAAGGVNTLLMVPSMSASSVEYSKTKVVFKSR